MQEELIKALRRELELWEASQKDQQDGYEYERSFVELWRKLGQQILQASLGKVPKSRNEKKV